jgi:hypothetical protein
VRLNRFLIMAVSKTLCRWNEREWRYAAVAFGEGSAFVAACESLRVHLSAPGCSGQTCYFGDLDPKGLWIPARAAQASGLKIVADESLYTLLLAKGKRNHRLPRLEFSLDPAVVEWLPSVLRPETVRNFKSGRRLPQELISMHDLGFPPQHVTSVAAFHIP